MMSIINIYWTSFQDSAYNIFCTSREEISVDIVITFPGGKKVNAEMNGMTIATDQPKKLGGDDTAPSPYALFLASIGTCAGIYVLSFCRERKIPTDAISLSQRLEYATTAEGKSKLSKILLEIHVPADFPEKYHAALVKVAEQCAVKKTIQDPPQFEVRTIVGI
jgi:putative redox protein